MAKKGLKRKFNDEEENRKDYLSYHSVRLYSATDIPVTQAAKSKNDFVPPSALWADFDPTDEPLNAERLEESGNYTRFSFLAASYPDGNLSAEIRAYTPPYYARKAVLLIGERDALPQQEVIDEIVERVGAYVFVVDYNGIGEDSATLFPPSLFYGKRGNEGDRDRKFGSSPKDTCPYVYTLILRRAVAFIKTNFPKTELAVVGIRDGVELAMAVAGLERKNVMALGCLCACGYKEFAPFPKYPHAEEHFDLKKMSFIVSLSGVSHLKKYPHPVFCAVGSNGTYSDVDRLSSLKALIAAPLTLSVTPQFSDNVGRESFDCFLSWLNQSFWGSDFPAPPVTTVDVNRDGTVYADVTATATPALKGAILHYSYNDNNHHTRVWNSVACETVGVGQYLAKMTFTKPAGYLYFYTEASYLNGAVSTETPKFLDMSSYRLALSPAKNTAVLFRYGAEGLIVAESKQPILLTDAVEEKSVPAGVKGAICNDGALLLYVKEAFSATRSDRILQVDSFKEGPNYDLEVVARLQSGAVYRAIKRVAATTNFVSTQFTLTDFKDDKYLPLPEWADVATLTVVTPGIAVNKITFI